MYLIIIIPCFNEEKTIDKVISEIPEHFENINYTDILVIDDGSSDLTVSKAQKAGAIVYSHNTNLGVGVAFNTGINEALKLKADIVVNMDGDGQFNPSDIPKLIEPIMNNNADFVSASRFKDKTLEPEMPLVKKLGNKLLAKLISFLTGQRFYDVSCGFRAYSQEALLQLNLNGKFTYTQEAFLDLAFKGLKILEVPVQVQGEREYGESRVASNLWKYAYNTSKIIFRTFRDYKPLRFFGLISAVLFLISLSLGIFFFHHYFQTGHFSGHLWAGFSAGFTLLFSILIFVTGLMADMLDRIRKNQEKLLYYEKKRLIKKDHE